MKLRKTGLSAIALAAAAFATVSCSDGGDANRMPPVGAEGRDPATTERDYAAGRTGSDLEITQRVRQAISSNEGISMQARNVEVETEDGVVTLRGPVTSEQERAQMESLARSAGATRIDNELEVDRDDMSGDQG